MVSCNVQTYLHAWKGFKTKEKYFEYFFYLLLAVANIIHETDQWSTQVVLPCARFFFSYFSGAGFFL